MTKRLWVALLLLGFAGACSARNTSPLPTSGVDLVDAAAKIRLSPKSLLIALKGSAGAKMVRVSEKGYTGTFKGTGCARIAKASPASGHGPALKVKIAGVKSGLCAIVFSDAHANTATLPVYVASPAPTTPSPSPSSSAAPSPSPAPSPSATPSLAPTPTPTPKPGAGVYVADFGTNEVEQIAPNGTMTCVPSNVTLANCNTTGFGQPFGVVVDALGNVYVANEFINEVEKIAASNQAITSVGSGFDFPTGVAVDGAGDVYVADNGNDEVKEVAPNGTITCVPSTLTLANCANAGFSEPKGVAVDPNCTSDCNVYVADSGNAQVVMVAASGTMTCVPATLSLAMCPTAGFSVPEAVALPPNCNSNCKVYVADASSNVVKVVTPAGTITTIGSGFDGPTGVAVDTAGDVYVGDSVNGTVKEVTPNGTIYTIGSGFTTPRGIALDAAGDPFVRVHRKVKPNKP